MWKKALKEIIRSKPKEKRREKMSALLEPLDDYWRVESTAELTETAVPDWRICALTAEALKMFVSRKKRADTIPFEIIVQKVRIGEWLGAVLCDCKCTWHCLKYIGKLYEKGALPLLVSGYIARFIWRHTGLRVNSSEGVKRVGCDVDIARKLLLKNHVEHYMEVPVVLPHVCRILPKLMNQLFLVRNCYETESCPDAMFLAKAICESDGVPLAFKAMQACSSVRCARRFWEEVIINNPKECMLDHLSDNQLQSIYPYLARKGGSPFTASLCWYSYAGCCVWECSALKFEAEATFIFNAIIIGHVWLLINGIRSLALFHYPREEDDDFRGIKITRNHLIACLKVSAEMEVGPHASTHEGKLVWRLRCLYGVESQEKQRHMRGKMIRLLNALFTCRVDLRMPLASAILTDTEYDALVAGEHVLKQKRLPCELIQLIMEFYLAFSIHRNPFLSQFENMNPIFL